MDTDIQLVDDPALNNISSINTRQTLLIVNDFISHTVDFMNKFATISEQKLYQITQKTEKLDILISLLEAKLESIPLHETDYSGPGVSTKSAAVIAIEEGMVEVGQPAPPAGPPGGQPPPPPPQGGNFSSGSSLSAAAEQALAQINGDAEAKQGSAVVAAPAPPTTSGALVESQGGLIKNDPRYKKYFTMLACRIPLPAVLQKVVMNGDDIDTSILSLDPETPVSATNLPPIVDGDDSD